MDAASNAFSNLFGSSRNGGNRRSSANYVDDDSDTVTRYDSITGRKSGGSFGNSASGSGHSHSFSASSRQADTTVSQEVAPAVTHQKLVHQHETRDETQIDRTREQHHYHTTIQPLKDREVKETQHNRKTAGAQNRSFDHDDGKAKQRPSFKSSTEETSTNLQGTKETVVVSDNIHHYIHEVIQPVIEKETIVPSVTTTFYPVHEKHTEVSMNHGVTTNAPMSVSEFKHKLAGEMARKLETYNGEPQCCNRSDSFIN